MNHQPILVIGAGPSGLGCASALSTMHKVELIDRIPVAGGAAGWESPEVRQLVQATKDSGVQFRLGVTALKWEGNRLLLSAPGQISWIPSTALFYAGGFRPATIADLKITGERPAGILPATVAEHLLVTGVSLWQRVVIIGSGPWAKRLAQLVHAYGGRVILIKQDSDSNDWADETINGADQMRVLGRSRVRALKFQAHGVPREIACDAIILAANPYPNRNVEGALVDPSPGVTFVQPFELESISDRYESGRQVALQWLDQVGGAE